MKRLPFFPKKTPSRSIEIVYVGAVIAAFIAIVAVTLGASSIWFDEAFGAYLIRFNFAEIASLTGADVHPPLYYWLLKLWSLCFGTSDVALRSMSVLFAVIMLIVGYFFVRRVFGKKAAMITLPLLALSPFLVRYTQEARMYTVVAAIGIGATYALYEATQRPSKKRWILYGVLVSLGVWTHYFTILIWLAHWVWRAIETRQKSIKKWAKAFFTKEWIWTHVLAVGLYLPWLPLMVAQVVQVQKGFWIPPIGPDTVPAYVSDVFLYLSVGKTTPWLTVLLWVLLGLSIYLVWRAYKHFRNSKQKAYRLLLVSALAPIVILMALSLPPLKSTFVNRYILTAAICAVAVIAIAIAVGPKKLVRMRMAAGVILVVLSVIGITNVYHYGNFNQTSGQKTEIKSVIEQIQATSGTSGEPIIAASPWLYYEAAAYSSSRNEVYFIDASVRYIYGSLEPLRRHDVGKIKDLNTFKQAHSTFWYVGRPGDEDFSLNSPGLTMIQALYVPDSVTGKSAYRAIQYEVSAE